jgi:hypothetical protein
MWAFCLLSSVSLPAQSSITRHGSPKAAIDEFLRRGIDGGLLTSEDWNKAEHLFVHPSIPPTDKSVVLIGEDYSVHEIWVRGNQAEVFASYRDLGRIDSALHFSPPDPRFQMVTVRYHLILVTKSSQSTAVGPGTQTFVPEPEWRIENPPKFRLVGVHAAIGYVTDMRGKAGEPTIKKNSGSTLAILTKMKE